MPLSYRLLALALLATGIPSLLAQPPMPPAASPQADPRLDQLLAAWERETANCQTMAAEVKCSRINKVFNRTEVLTGHAKFMRLPTGEYAAKLDLRSPGNPNRDERYLCTGAAIYVFRPEEKLIHVYTLPPRKAGQLPDDGALPFLFGMRADVAKKRYQLRIDKQDENYTYLYVIPNFARDQADFTFARLAILNRDFPSVGLVKNLPREIYWVEPNNVEVRWEIQTLKRDNPAAVQRTEFVQPNLRDYPGWDFKYVNANTTGAAAPPPSVIRPQDGK